MRDGGCECGAGFGVGSCVICSSNSTLKRLSWVLLCWVLLRDLRCCKKLQYLEAKRERGTSSKIVRVIQGPRALSTVQLAS